MAEKLLVPIYLPRWVNLALRKAKRAFIPPAPAARAVNIWGERNVEWAFLSTEMPNGPGEAIEFGCEQGYMSLLAAQKGFHVLANDLQEQSFTWEHPNVEFKQGDFLKLELPHDHFDLAINCSSVEHVGVAGRYGITVDESDGDLEVMKKLAEILKPGGRLIMTAPCGRDAVMAPWCRVYGRERLPRLFAFFALSEEEYWIKNGQNRWIATERETALDYQPLNNPADPHGCTYALGCFILSKSSTFAATSPGGGRSGGLAA
ncbi:MAG: class I SAM-dependent methyltransferase [Candidatus Acidiferrum sp.]